MIVDKINTYLTEQGKTIHEYYAQELGKLAEFSFKRQFCTDEEPVSKGKIRLSAAGKCPRALAYAYHGFEKKGKELDSRSKIVFFQGDMVEAMVTQLARLAGCALMGTGLNQVNVSLDINGTSVPGHPDGFLIHDQEIFLFECKSMSSFSYARFEQGELDPGYIAQMESYMETVSKSVRRACIVAVNKDSGVINERIIDREDGLISEIRLNLAQVIKSTPESLPNAPRTHDCDEKGVYPWMCLYCSFWGICRPNASKTLVGKSYKLKEQPRKEKKDEDDCDATAVDIDRDQ